MASRVFIEVLPSPILCTSDVLKWEPFEVKGVDRLTVFRPIASGGPSRSIHPEINFDKTLIQIRARGELKVLPQTRVLPGLKSSSSEVPSLYMIPANLDDETKEVSPFPIETITLEIHGRTDLGGYREEFLKQLRRRTRQVWTGRAAVYLDPPGSCAIDLNGNRVAAARPVFSFGPMSFRMRGITLCSEETWRESWRLAMMAWDGNTVDSDSDDEVHEAHHRILSDQWYDCLFDAGVVVEKLKYRLWDALMSRKKCSTSQYRDALNDTKKPHRYFGEQLEAAIRRSLLKERRTTYEFVKKIWIARGLVAHGKTKQLVDRFGKDELDSLKTASTLELYSLSEFVKSAITHPSS